MTYDVFAWTFNLTQPSTTVPRICGVYVCFSVYLVILHMCCIVVTQWGGPGGIEA